MGSSYRDLNVWQRSKAATIRIYVVTQTFPRRETYGLTSQMRSAASSVPANIAEGHGRGSAADFVRFLRISVGSLCELETYLDISVALQYLTAEHYAELMAETDEIGKMLHGLIDSIRRNAPPP
jgi:four helix bundle protein